MDVVGASTPKEERKVIGLDFPRKRGLDFRQVARIALIVASGAVASPTVFAQPSAAAVCRASSAAVVPAIVELYTSEGCNSCPPADRWLSSVVANPAANVIALAFHVDYWDYIGWRDVYAKPAYGERQRKLVLAAGSTTVYTPQIFVNGRDDRSWHVAAIPRANSPARAKLSLEAEWSAHRIKLRGRLADAKEPLRIRYALTENAITTAVKAGENKGELLAHDAIVREHAFVAADQNGGFVAEITPPSNQKRERSQLHVIAETRQGEAVAAASLRCAN